MQRPKTSYTCKECNAPATVSDGKILRTCEHTEAGVIAHLSALARGVSSLKNKRKAA